MKKLPSHFVREFIRPLKLDNCFVCVSDQLVKHFGVSFCRESYTINLYDNSHDKVNGIKIYTILFNYELREKCSFKKEKVFQFDISIKNKLLAYLFYYLVIFSRNRINYC